MEGARICNKNWMLIIFDDFCLSSLSGCFGSKIFARNKESNICYDFEGRLALLNSIVRLDDG